MTDQDQTALLQSRLAEAHSQAKPVCIIGQQSKSFYGNPQVGTPLSLAEHTGIINYEPTELVLTARAGTALADIEKVLAGEGQSLAFDPPQFGGHGSLGGAIASGLAGPGRPWLGGVRDMILGVKILNGQAELMRFGGEVMKNVAGYDVSRLMVGALGTLGVITEASVKVLPAAVSEATLVQTQNSPVNLHALSEQLLREGRPITALISIENQTYLRLAGTESAVQAACQAIDGDPMPASESRAFWMSIRDHAHAFFADTQAPLWRISLPPGTPITGYTGERLVDWAGQQLWLRSDMSATAVRALAAEHGGSATLFRGQLPDCDAFQPLDAVQTRLHQRIKRSFDAEHILNPARLYREMEAA